MDRINQQNISNFFVKKPTALSAPDYIDHLMDWIQNQIFDENIFPRDCSTSFPKVIPENNNLRGSITVQLTSCLFCLDSATLLLLN